MLEFRLIYQGLLPTNGNAQEKHQIRRYLHRQLVELWKIREPLKSRGSSGYGAKTGEAEPIYRDGINFIADQHVMGNKRFLPIVRSEWALRCALDVLILKRRDIHAIAGAGDLDNQAKTLLDALQIPSPSPALEGDEDPLYCLLENDKSVAELKLTADLLLCPPEQIVHSPKVNFQGDQIVKDNHAIAVINVRVSPYKVILTNIDFG
jgi:hypothetical protein